MVDKPSSPCSRGHACKQQMSLLLPLLLLLLLLLHAICMHSSGNIPLPANTHCTTAHGFIAP
jgi:hypothetical protein